MTAIVIERFGGIAPRYDATALPPYGAQVAQNARLHAGVLKGFRPPAGLTPPVYADDTIQTIFYETGEDNWFAWSKLVDIVLGPVADETNARRYYYTGDGVPKKTDALMAFGNLLTFGKEFDNAAWTKTNSTVTANSTTAPDGTLTADTITDNTTAAVGHYVYQSKGGCTANAPYAVRVYMKAGTSR